MSYMPDMRVGAFGNATVEELQAMLDLLDSFYFDEESLDYYLEWAQDMWYERVSPAYIIDDMHRNKRVR